MLGMIGGMSWVSTAFYYQKINQHYAQKLGGLHSAPLLIESHDFALIEPLQRQDDWQQANQLMVESAQRLAQAGAGAILIATNTMHQCADAVIDAIEIPLLHIADITAKTISEAGLSRPGLIATRYTMERDFYLSRLRAYQLEPLVPAPAEREQVQRIIYDELCRDQVLDASKQVFVQVAQSLIAQGADSMILGCTEVGLLLQAQDLEVAVFDTTVLHARAGADWLVQARSSMI